LVFKTAPLFTCRGAVLFVCFAGVMLFIASAPFFIPGLIFFDILNTFYVLFIKRYKYNTYL